MKPRVEEQGAGGEEDRRPGLAEAHERAADPADGDPRDDEQIAEWTASQRQQRDADDRQCAGRVSSYREDPRGHEPAAAPQASAAQ
jgi:hypothetical protein